MNKLEQAARQALEALEVYGEHAKDCPQYPTYTRPQDYPKCDCGFEEAIAALREALDGQAECKECSEKQAQIDRLMLEYCPDEMTPEQMLEWGNNQRPVEQAEQGPVAIGSEWKPCMKLPVVVHVREQREGESHVSTREGITPVRPDDLIMRGVAGEEYPIGRELFNKTYTFDTAAPVRTKDLTDDEICRMWNDWHDVVGAGEFALIARAVIAADREKNNGL